MEMDMEIVKKSMKQSSGRVAFYYLECLTSRVQRLVDVGRYRIPLGRFQIISENPIGW
jgi:hypothetical protein